MSERLDVRRAVRPSERIDAEDEEVDEEQNENDEPEEDRAGGEQREGVWGETQSRSNRWKAKHEAMLKQAGEEGKSQQQVFESSSLVITLNETTRREEGELEGSAQSEKRQKSGLDSREPARLTRRNMKPVLAV